jgi:hypothetical protein
MKNQSRVALTDDYFATHAKDIERVFRLAVTEAVRMHKRLGNPVAVWKDGKVLIVPPEEIIIPTDVTEPNE